jgi:hypothetical protein
VKPPKNLSEYYTAEEAALAFEEIAKDLRKRSEDTPLVSFAVSLSFWNPRWSQT